MTPNTILRQLPAVDALLRSPAIAQVGSVIAHEMLVEWLQQAIQDVRIEVLGGEFCNTEVSNVASISARIIQKVLCRQRSDRSRCIQAVINATGTILHTNLGRAPLAPEAVDRMRHASASTNVELDLESGKRCSRAARVMELLARATGAEDALVVNNCAAALMLALQAVSNNRETIVSRGQLVEIGGGFRLPEVIQSAGVVLREVGTTNRTYLSDYQAAIGEATGAILKVHRSNFTQTGFVTEPTTEQLVQLAGQRQVPVVDDVGSGSMVDLSQFGLTEPLVCDSIRAGVDLCLFSGDKLFGGPQAGIVVGKKSWIDRLRKHPVMRALRVDKVTLAALEATVEIHLSGQALEKLPVLRMIARPADSIRVECERLCDQLSTSSCQRVRVAACHSSIGGGTLPGQELPSFCIAVEVPHVDAWAKAMRLGAPPTLCRVSENRLLLDLRTVDDSEVDALALRLDEVIRDACDSTPFDSVAEGIA